MKKGYIFIGLLIVLVSGVFFAKAALAFDYTMMEKIPGFDNTTDFPSMIQNLYGFTISTVGVAALFMITLGGFWYMTSAGDSGRMTTAKGMISDAILGLIIVFIAYLLLYVINPDLVNVNITFKMLSMDTMNTKSGQTTTPATPTPASPATPSPSPSPAPATKGASCSASKNSDETNNVISCMKGKSGLTLGTVTSNSGRHVCNPPNSISCHYGGRNCNGIGNAVDYGGPGGAFTGLKDTAMYTKLVSEARGCGAAIARCEDGNGKEKPCSDTSVDHIHATVNANCGCS